MSKARETTINIRASQAEKHNWRQVAPDGKLGPWLRELANLEMKRARKSAKR